MINLKQFEIWFVTGCQDWTGEETQNQAAAHLQIMGRGLEEASQIPVKIVIKPVAKKMEEINSICRQANAAKDCVGVIAWMHTFSPAKIWVGGMDLLEKPLLQLHTQYNNDIPWNSVDIDYMNLNSNDHCEGEFAYKESHMALYGKFVVGHWQDKGVLEQINSWSRTACAWHDWQGAKFVRFGDPMQYVTLTSEDKIKAKMKLGFTVDTRSIGDLARVVDEVSIADIDHLTEQYQELYIMGESIRKGGDLYHSLREAARIEIGLDRFLQGGNYKGFSDTFEDMHGMHPLPGIAAQRLMAQGYGFASEGDWKTAALVRAMKVMGSGLPGGNAFMEDYTYYFNPDNQLVLGSHMLEMDASIAKGKPWCEPHPQGTGGMEDPLHLVFEVPTGPAINAAFIDMGNRYRLLVNEVEAIEPEPDLSNLPEAGLSWKPLPDMKTACAAWMLAGGAYHTCYSQNLSAAQLQDFAGLTGMECVIIDRDTKLNKLTSELRRSRMYKPVLNR